MEVCHDARASACPMLDNLGCGPALGMPPPSYATERVTVTRPRSPTIADAKNACVIAFQVRREARVANSASSKSFETHTRQSSPPLP